MVRKRRGCLARRSLRRAHRAAIHMLLRLFHDHWPPQAAPVNESERSRRQLVSEYDAWVNEGKGPVTAVEPTERTD